MSLKGKYTSVDSIIERVRRAGITDFTKEEAKEWVWESVSLLGVPTHLVNKVGILEVENGRASLPYDLSDMSEGGIRDYYSKKVLTKMSDIYHDPDRIGELANNANLSFEAPSVVFIDGLPVDEGKGFITAQPSSIESDEFPTYRINKGMIETGFKSGVIEIAYKSFPIDNEGNPMIEDDVKTIRAVVAYISKAVVNRLWLRDEISDRKKAAFDRDYSFAAAAARSNANIGSIDDWEAMRERSQRLYRDTTLHGRGYKGYGLGEELNFESL